MREHDLPVPNQGRKALHSERDDIFPDLHGLDLKGRLRAAFLTDRGLRTSKEALPSFLRSITNWCYSTETCYNNSL